MFEQPKEVFFYGKKSPLPDTINLKAGPLEMDYREGYIKNIKCGGVEILRMVYAALRDAHWNTISSEISDEVMEFQDDCFKIKYKAAYKQKDINFEANFTLEGTKDGTIRFLMKGKSFSVFQKNRIGFCVLHPASLAEKEMQVKHFDGNQEKGILPLMVSPSPIFKNIKALNWQANEEIMASLSFDGDRFEMEDQRNYGDDSFKIYSTPIEVPFPTEMTKGDIVEQEVILKVNKPEGAIEIANRVPVVFNINDEKTSSMPSIGIGRSSAKFRLSEEELAHLKNIRFSHLRVDLHLYRQQEWQQVYHEALVEAMHNSYLLELALFFKDDVTKQAQQVLQRVDPAQVKYVNLYAADQDITPSFILEHIVPMFKKAWPEVKIGAGTDGYLVKFNSNPIQDQQLDFVCYSLNPQVHVFDNESLIETAKGSTYGIKTAREIAKRPVHISPYTLKERNKKNDTSEAIPASIDVRQMSLFTAGLTISNLKHMAQTGVESITLFESDGEKGIMMGEEGSRYQEYFADPFTFYPVYFVLKEILTGDNWKVVHSQSSERTKVDGICIRKNGNLKMLLANLTPFDQVAHVSRESSLKALISYYDHKNAPEFYQNPNYKAVAETKLTDQALQVQLLPYAFVVIEFIFN